MTKVRVCVFCGKADSIPRSHIIPEFFYDLTYDTKPRSMIQVDAALNQINVRQKGYYEPLLCRTCEGFFSKEFESPCADIVRSLPDKPPPSGSITLPRAPRLRHLILSIVWRASHATGPDWGHLELGPHQERLRQSLERLDIPANYGCWVYGVHDDEGNVKKGLVTAVHTVRIQGQQMYHFVARGLQFVVKVSSHPFTGLRDKPVPADGSPFEIEFISLRKAPSTHAIFRATGRT